MNEILRELPRTDGEPNRAHASFNLRREEKRMLDHLQTWWSLRLGRDLEQIDAFSILFAAALRSGLLDIPSELSGIDPSAGLSHRLKPKGRGTREGMFAQEAPEGAETQDADALSRAPDLSRIEAELGSARVR